MLRGRRIDRRFLQRVGRKAVWTKAVLCPNLTEDGKHRYTCTYCTGDKGDRGYIYSDPQTIRIMFTSDSRTKEFDLAGAWERGECEATIAADKPIGDQDRVVTEDDPVRYQLQVERGTGMSDLLRVPNVVEIVLIRNTTTTYKEGTDYSLTTDTSGNSTLTWQAPTYPTEGSKYVVIMLIKPTWIIRGEPMVRAFGPGKRNQLLYKVKLQRFDAATMA